MVDDEVKHDIREIRSDVKELVKQGAVHNVLLREHERRSTLLEERFAPLEKDFVFRHRLFTVIFGSGGVIVLFEICRLLFAKH